ncbi:tetratricopeptide repeat protein [Labilibacter sediminis]|nr:tetratricopeptide repeat protein [Labilibacter sediminis]
MGVLFSTHFSLKSLTLFVLILCPLYVFSADHVKEDSLRFKLNLIEDHEEKVRLLMELTKLTRKYDLKKSIQYSIQGEKLSESNDDELNIAKFKLETGISNYFLGNYDETLSDYFAALTTFKEFNNYIGILRTLNNIGAIYDRLENFNSAIKYYQLTIQHYNSGNKEQKEKHINYLTQIFNNLASAYEKIGETDKAIEYYELSLSEAKKINFRHIIGSLYNNLGKIESNNGNFNIAREYLNNAIKIRTEDKEIEGLAKSYYFLSAHFFNTKDLDSAKWAANKSLEIAEKNNLLEAQQIAHMFLFDYYEAKKDYKNALASHKTFKAISDSLVSEQKINQLSKLQTKYEIEQLEEESLRQKERIKAQYTILVTILSAGLLVAVLLVFLLRTKKKRVELENNQLETEIETKNRELTTNVMYLVQKNELINNVAKSLLAVKDKVMEKNKQPIQQIIYNLQSQTDKEIWNEFEFRFNQVHNDFYSQLRAKHADITPSEERLCALLRLNLSSKEISTITHQTIRSIEVARGRLRKKLSLTGKDINLVSYLTDF